MKEMLVEWLDLKLAKNISVGTLTLAILFLALESYNLIELAYFKLFLWLYLFLNVGIATPLHYILASDNPDCPMCSTQLEARAKYHCPKCGELNYKK